MRKARIIGTGSTIPKRVLSNKDLESIVDTSDEWITRRTGIKQRHISSNSSEESTTGLASRASIKALKMAGVCPEDLDMIVVGTVTPDLQFPSTACMLQEELNAKNAAAFDVSAGCSGFLYALGIVNNAIRCGSCRLALVVGVERLSSITNWQDRSTCVLLGDGAGAVVVGSTTKHAGILSTHLKSDGSLGKLLYSSEGKIRAPKILRNIDLKPFHLKMEGNRLFKKAVACLTSIAKEALQQNSLFSKDVELMIPHQANIRIIKAMADNLKIPADKVFINIHKYGNTSSASIPIAMDEANQQGLLVQGAHILLVSVGAGLTWGASVLKWSM
ncbi:MAG: ketoacyl-ACP synthase III [Deltaproteobacteria bacterium]|nr:ketoacyl-ACP synthase III [Deltaproteobacteria bacterium]MBW2153870.1 ketoacyl-ACP synthase III [Deltaproteobacteria bacterium]